MTAGVTIRAATVADVESVLPMVARVVALHEEWDAARYRALGDVVERYRSWLPERVASLIPSATSKCWFTHGVSQLGRSATGAARAAAGESPRM